MSPSRPPACREIHPWSSVPDERFNSWTWQIKNRVDTLAGLEALFELTPEERDGFGPTSRLFRFAITPYYALLADPRDPSCPIRCQIVPRIEETRYASSELGDPLGEQEREAAPNLIHRYPDRALLLATDRCPVYCRFCTRRRIVGSIERQMTRALLEDAFAYVRDHPEIREVIVSGGDALVLADSQIQFILESVRAIQHIDIIRIASRMPVTCPMRITPALLQILRAHQPVYLMTHFNHPQECTEASRQACARLVDGGIPVYNQSVLLRGINDDTAVIRGLNRHLVRMRVTPYYLHQCDLAQGTEHFRTPLSTGLSIIDGLRGHTSGLAVPQLCVDVPGGLGKVTLQPDWVIGRDGKTTTFRTYSGQHGAYRDPD